MNTVSFTRMADGAAEDWALLATYEGDYMAALPDRILAALEKLNDSFGGYQVTRYTHSLQAATRALRDGRDDEYVVATLIHDIGDDLAPLTHGAMVAAILRPFVREEICWMIDEHPVFQTYYYGAHTGDDPNARDRFREHPHYALTAEFCELYDQSSFDPDYDTLPIEEFEPTVRRVFSEPRYSQGPG